MYQYFLRYVCIGDVTMLSRLRTYGYYCSEVPSSQALSISATACKLYPENSIDRVTDPIGNNPGEASSYVTMTLMFRNLG